jgi:hypothetical protein
MTQYWFKPKAHGYGATPANWKGWAATLAFLSVMVAFTYVLVASQQNAGSPPRDWVIAVWALGIALLTGGFVCLARAKTDGQWMWRWGKLSAMK